MQFEKLKTMTAVAEEMGLTVGRMSQLCKEHGIVGRKLGTARLLGPAEIRKLKQAPRRAYTKSS